MAKSTADSEEQRAALSLPNLRKVVLCCLQNRHCNLIRSIPSHSCQRPFQFLSSVNPSLRHRGAPGTWPQQHLRSRRTPQQGVNRCPTPVCSPDTGSLRTCARSSLATRSKPRGGMHPACTFDCVYSFRNNHPADACGDASPHRLYIILQRDPSATMHWWYVWVVDEGSLII